MGGFEGLLYGLQIAAQPENILAVFVGVAAGSLMGLIPGLGATTAAAVLFPLTMAMEPTAALIMIAGIYYGLMYGGSTTSVLLNIPGEAVSIAASFEGYPMSKPGRAGTALGTIAFGSFFAGTISVVAVTIASPQLARIGLLFGPIEFFALTLGGLLLLSRMLGGSVASGLLPMMIGLILGTVGADISSGVYRYTFGSLAMTRGFGIAPVAIGLFGLSEILRVAEDVKGFPPFQKVRFLEMLPSRTEIRTSLAPWVRGGVIGFLFGLLPGPSGTLATFTSYRTEKSIAKDSSQFGKGDIRGLAGPEAANNAAATASVIPILALGIPFSAVLAFMLAALIAQGIDPGPQIVTRHPEIFWGVIGSMYLGNLMLLVINVPMIGVWVRALSVPKELMIPVVIVVSFFGAYATSRAMSDVVIVVALGAIGYAFRLLGFQLAPIVVGILLGPMIERHFVASMTLGQGEWAFLLSSTPAKVIWGSVATFLILSSVLKRTQFIRRPPGPDDVADRPASKERQ